MTKCATGPQSTREVSCSKATIGLRGIRGAFNLVPVMPRDTSLSWDFAVSLIIQEVKKGLVTNFFFSRESKSNDFKTTSHPGNLKKFPA